MATTGYAHLLDRFNLECLRPPVAARVAPVTRVMREEEALLVPSSVAPEPHASPVEHLLFALRYEGVDMALIDALAHNGAIQDTEVRAAISARPAGAFTRKLGYLWETITGRDLQDVAGQGKFVELFDPQLYYTAQRGARNAKWRVDFNGLGVPEFCPVVRKTPELARLLERDLFAEVELFAEQVRGAGLLDRILAWAYLDETRSSYEIEHEDAPRDKAEAFAAVLKNAQDARPMDEPYLVDLQNLIITNPMAREPGYRNQQNWLGRGGHGVLAVRYVPPAPEVLDDLMAGLLRICNEPRASDALLHAALCSFGFVYLHPFMDGNGRLSRFLFHHALCMKRVLPEGLILPVSTAMHKNEQGYLTALEVFSKEARQLWDVRWIDANRYTFVARCRDSVYRYWDATAQAAFSVRMAHQAMDVHLVGEANFLAGFDKAYKALDRKLDLSSAVLQRLIILCHEQGGRLSANRRKQYKDDMPAEYFDEIEKSVTHAFNLGKG